MATATPSAPDPYALVDGFESSGIIDDAYFGYDDKYMSGASPILILEIDPLDGDGETRRQFFSFGDNFELSDDGQEITHKSGDKTKMPGGSTSLGKLITSATQLPDLIKVFRHRGVPTQAKIWKGLALDIVQTSKEVKFRDEVRKQNTTTVTAFYPTLSVLDDAEVKMLKLDAAGSGSGAKEAAPAVELGAYGIPTTVEGALRELAQSATSEGEFQQRALAEVPGVEGDSAAEALVADPNFFAAMKAGE